MIILKTLSDQVIVFDEVDLNIFNQRDHANKDKLFLALGMIIFACIGISLQTHYKAKFFLLSWIVLLVTWIVYFLKQLFNTKYPEKVPYSEIDKINITYVKKHYSIEIYYTNNKSPICLTTKFIDDNLFSFLREMKIKIYEFNL